MADRQPDYSLLESTAAVCHPLASLTTIPPSQDLTTARLRFVTSMEHPKASLELMRWGRSRASTQLDDLQRAVRALVCLQCLAHSVNFDSCYHYEICYLTSFRSALQLVRWQVSWADETVNPRMHGLISDVDFSARQIGLLFIMLVLTQALHTNWWINLW